MSKKKILVLFLAALIVVFAGIGIYNLAANKNESPTDDISMTESNKSEKTEDGELSAEKDITEQNEKTEEQQINKNDAYMPTFMYFVSNSDADFKNTQKMIDELKKEYDGRVKFDIINIDEQPEMKKSFPVEGQTPALIMLNINNDISAFEFVCNDKQKLVKSIEDALN